MKPRKTGVTLVLWLALVAATIPATVQDAAAEGESPPPSSCSSRGGERGPAGTADGPDRVNYARPSCACLLLLPAPSCQRRNQGGVAWALTRDIKTKT
ncbi:hypothetical protein MRX96_008922 [Rhipicephalus microplus]